MAPGQTVLFIRLPMAVKARLRKLAKAADRPMSSYLRELILKAEIVHAPPKKGGKKTKW